MLKRMRVMYDGETGLGGSGGGTPDLSPATNATVEINTGEPISVSNDVSSLENQNNQDKPKQVDFETLDLNTNPNFIKENYEQFKDLGVNIDHPQFQKIVGNLEQLGITDLETQGKLIKQMREKYLEEQDRLKPENIQKTLSKSLNEKEKANYPRIVQSIKNALISQGKGDVAPKLLQYICSEPSAIQLLSMMHDYYTRGQQPTPSAGAMRTGGGISYDNAITAYQEAMTAAHKAGKSDSRQEIMKQILNRVNAADKIRVKDYFGI
jgi:hypothetical protein